MRVILYQRIDNFRFIIHLIFFRRERNTMTSINMISGGDGGCCGDTGCC